MSSPNSLSCSERPCSNKDDISVEAEIQQAYFLFLYLGMFYLFKSEELSYGKKRLRNSTQLHTAVGQTEKGETICTLFSFENS